MKYLRDFYLTVKMGLNSHPPRFSTKGAQRRPLSYDVQSQESNQEDECISPQASSFLKAILVSLVCGFALHLTLAPLARADWINLTGAETAPNIAEIYILDDHIKLVLEIYIRDLVLFDDLVPDDWVKTPASQRPSLPKRLRHFASHTFQFVTETGERLQAQLELVEPRERKDRQSPFAGMINPSTRQRVPEPPSDKRVLYAELKYPFNSKPETITMSPPRDDEGRAKVTIGFIAYHKSVPIIDFRYLGNPARLTLNWKDPWYSKFDNPNLKRHHKSALMSFLYVEPYEVRHEILTRVKDLEAWMDLGLRGSEYVEVDELDPLKQRIGEFLQQKNPVLVDGRSLSPILDRTNYVKVGLTGIQLLEQPKRLEISTAIVGVIIAYVTEGMPQEVTVDWELFTDQVQQVPTTATDPAGPFPSFVTPEDPVLKWTNYLKNYTIPTVHTVSLSETVAPFHLPLGTALCVVALFPLGWYMYRRIQTSQSIRFPLGIAVGLVAGGVMLVPMYQIPLVRPAALVKNLSDEEASKILHALFKNVYRAFDFRQEEDVYDKLALSVEGDLLADMYLQNRKSFAVKKAGGAQAKVNEVEVLETHAEAVEDRPGAFALKGQWTAMGTVGHWGHVHTRKNHYEAIVTVEPIAGNWKIIDLELLEEKRVDPYPQSATSSPKAE